MNEAAARHMAFLVEAGKVLGASLDYETTLASLARLTLPVLGDRCSIDVIGEDGVLRRIVLLVWDPDRGAIPESNEHLYRTPMSSTLLRVIERCETLYAPFFDPGMLDRAIADPEAREVVRRLGMRSLVVAPLPARGAVLGALSVAMSTSGRRHTPEDAILAEELGRRAAVAIDNARLHAAALRAARRSEEALAERIEREAALSLAKEELCKIKDELERRVEERTRALSEANAELLRREAQLAQAETLAHMGSWEWDPETRTSVASPELCRIFGLDPMVTSRGLGDLFEQTHPDDKAHVREGVQRALRSGKSSDIEYRIRRPDGAERVLLTRCQLVTRDGGGQRIVGMARDITEEKAAEQRLRASLSEKEVLLREVHHRVKNNLQVISSLLQLQCGHTEDRRLVELIRESQARVQTIALVHDAIHRSGDLARIDLEKYLRRLVTALLGVYQADAAQVEVHADPVRLGIDAVVHCGLIVNELVTNAFKHAYRGGRGGPVRISVERCGEGEAILSVADRGVGIPPSVDLCRARSLGLRLVATLAEQLGGSVEVHREGGTRVEIRMPVAPAEAP